MKLNRKMMIAALIAGTVFAADFAVRGQDTNTASTNTPPAGARPPGGRTGRNFDTIATQLALTDDQKTKVKPVFDDLLQKMADLRKDTNMDPTERRAKYKEIRDDATAKLKEILTPDQFAKWQKMGQGSRPRPATQPPTGGTTPPAGTTPPQ